MDDQLLMIPGPTPLSAGVRAALSEPVQSHTSAAVAATIRAIQVGIRSVVGSADARVHAFAGSGTLAMEAALVNHSAVGDRVVVVSHGYFGDRFAEIAAAHGMEATVVSAPWGSHADPEAVRNACVTGRAPAVVTITHVDTSTGVLADVPSLVEAASSSGALVVLDGVCATGGVDERMDDWGVDVILTGAQKALGVPPGLALLAVSKRAQLRRVELGRIAAYYADLARWDRVVDDPTTYFSTHSVSLLRALEVSLMEVQSEGLVRRLTRHIAVAERLRSGMRELGFTSLCRPNLVAPTLSVLATPDNVGEANLRAAMAGAGVVLAPCLGPFAGRGIRVGHMGSAGMPEVETVLRTCAQVLHSGAAAVHGGVTSGA